MRVAIFSDIHGNLGALDAVLADIARERVDQRVCLGDVAATGPQPVETIRRLQKLNCPVVMGNTDERFLNPQPDEVAVEDFKRKGLSDEDAHRLADLDTWAAEQLSSDNLEFVRTFQPTVEVPLGGGRTLLCFHGSPRSNEDIIRSDTPEEDLERLLSGLRAKIMAGGHTHTQMLRRHQDSILINPGSVGLPFERNPDTGQIYNPSWAEYALVGSKNGNLSIEFRRVPVDVDAVIRSALNSGMPHVEWWAGDWRRD